MDFAGHLAQEEVISVEIPAQELDKFRNLLENMIKKFDDPSTSREEKIQILTLIPLSWPIADIKKWFKTTDYMIQLSRKVQSNFGPMSKPALRQGK